MFTIFVLLTIPLPLMADNIKPVLPESTKVNYKLVSLINDSLKLPKLAMGESTTLDISEKSSFLSNNQMLRNIIEANINTHLKKDDNKFIPTDRKDKILMGTKYGDKRTETENEYEQYKHGKSSQELLKNVEVLQTKTLKLECVSLDSHKLFAVIEEYYNLPMNTRKNQQQTDEAEDELNLQVIDESSNDKSNKVKEKHTQIRANQILNTSTIDNLECYTQLKSKRSIKTSNHKLDMNFILHTANASSPTRYTEVQKNHKDSIETIKSHSRRSYFKSHIQTDDQKIQIPSEEYFKWPTWIEQSATVSFYRGSHIPIDIPQFEEQGVSDSGEDNRIITTLMHSQMRVEPKIVQGTVAQARDFPFLVSLKRVVQKISKTRLLWKNYCGGSIVNSNKVVTAAHCFEMNKYDYYYHPNKLRVVAGNLTNKLYHSGNTSNSNQHQVRQIKLVKLHRDFNFPMNDIALVFVDEPFRFNNPMRINFIVPARYHTDYASQCYAAGFGQTGPKQKKDGSDKLLYAEVNLLPRRECNKVWEMNMISFLCSPNVFKGVSGGDSGGPVACFESLDPSSKIGSGKLLVGIVSGKNYDKTTLYTRISAFRKWIDTNGSCVLEYRITIVLFALIKGFKILYA